MVWPWKGMLSHPKRLTFLSGVAYYHQWKFNIDSANDGMEDVFQTWLHFGYHIHQIPRGVPLDITCTYWRWYMFNLWLNPLIQSYQTFQCENKIFASSIPSNNPGHGEGGDWKISWISKTAILHDYWSEIRASRIMNPFFFHTSKKVGLNWKKAFSGFPGFGEQNLTLVHPGLSEAENPEDYYYYSYYLHLGFHSIFCVFGTS